MTSHQDFVRELGISALGTRLRRLLDQLNDPVTALYRDMLGFEQRWFALTLYLDSEGASTIGHAAIALGQSHAAIVQTVNAMFAVDLVRRDQNPDDRRSSLISLTESGCQMALSVKTVSKTVDCAARQLIDQAAPDLLSLLDRLDDALQDRPFRLRLADVHPSPSKDL